MSAISKWLLAVFVVAVIGVLADLLFSGSRMSKVVRSAAATVTLLIIVAPLPALIKNGFSGGETVFEYSPELDENFLNAVSVRNVRVLERGVEAKLESGGLPDARVTISSTREGEEIIIVQVVVNLSETVIDENSAHINKNELAVKLVAEYLDIDEGKVSAYG